jgi:DDE superfamily endonuclease
MPHNLSIIDYSIGHTGSVHDSHAFQSTRVSREHETILEKDEWIWADSAYPVTPWCVPPFKKPPRGELSRNEKIFNYHLSRIRIRSEHTIGLLKGRFQSLHELRIQIGSRERHLWAIIWIRCCFILHNLIIKIEGNNNDDSWMEELMQAGLDPMRLDPDEEGWPAPAFSEEEEQEEDILPQVDLSDLPSNFSVGQVFRHRVMHALFTSGRL